MSSVLHCFFYFTYISSWGFFALSLLLHLNCIDRSKSRRLCSVISQLPQQHHRSVISTFCCPYADTLDQWWPPRLIYRFLTGTWVSHQRRTMPVTQSMRVTSASITRLPPPELSSPLHPKLMETANYALSIPVASLLNETRTGACGSWGILGD